MPSRRFESHHRAALALLAALLGGCGDNAANDSTGTTGGAGGSGSGPSAACAAILAQCLQNQQSCVDDGASAHCEACPQGQYANADSGACTAIPGTPLSHAFSDFTVQPGEEVLGLCQSWTLNNEEGLWVNSIEMVQDEASHHSNWMFVTDDVYDGPDGVWSCDERGYHQAEAALYGGVLYAQSTQAAKEVQKFPDGAAIRIPAHARIIGDVHLLNTSSEAVKGHLELHIYEIPKDEVKIKLAPFHLDYHGLDIPPHAKSRFFGECKLDEKFNGLTGNGMKMNVYYILPHTHAMASRFFLEVMGGPADGKSLLDIQGFNGEAHGRQYLPPVDMAGATGFRFGCEYESTRDESVGWGYGDQEMCELLGFAESPAAFETRVSSAEAAGSEGDIQLFTAPCDVPLFVPWSNN